jgi:hypothetical protein
MISVILNLLIFPFRDKVSIPIYLNGNFKKYKDNITPIYKIKHTEDKALYYIVKYELEWVNFFPFYCLLFLIPLNIYRWEYKYKSNVNLPKEFNISECRNKELSVIYEFNKALLNIPNKETEKQIIEKELNKVWTENYFGI